MLQSFILRWPFNTLHGVRKTCEVHLAHIIIIHVHVQVTSQTHMYSKGFKKTAEEEKNHKSYIRIIYRCIHNTHTHNSREREEKKRSMRSSRYNIFRASLVCI